LLLLLLLLLDNIVKTLPEVIRVMMHECYKRNCSKTCQFVLVRDEMLQ
jgi:hypothetical protein